MEVGERKFEPRNLEKWILCAKICLERDTLGDLVCLISNEMTGSCLGEVL